MEHSTFPTDSHTKYTVTYQLQLTTEGFSVYDTRPIKTKDMSLTLNNAGITKLKDDKQSLESNLKLPPQPGHMLSTTWSYLTKPTWLPNPYNATITSARSFLLWGCSYHLLHTSVSSEKLYPYTCTISIRYVYVSLCLVIDNSGVSFEKEKRRLDSVESGIQDLLINALTTDPRKGRRNKSACSNTT